MTCQINSIDKPRVHFCKFHMIVLQKTTTMSKKWRFKDYLDHAIDQLLREAQIKIFQHFLYHPFTITVNNLTKTYYKVPIRHAYMNIDYVKEQIEIHHGIKLADQDYVLNWAIQLTSDKNFINYGITRDIHIAQNSWSQLPWHLEQEKRCNTQIEILPPVKRVKRSPDRNLTTSQTYQQKCVGNILQTDSTEVQTD